MTIGVREYNLIVVAHKNAKVYGGRWCVERKLGRGGQGVVYEVTDTRKAPMADQPTRVLGDALSEFDRGQGDLREREQAMERLLAILRRLVGNNGLHRAALKKLLPMDQAVNPRAALKRMNAELETLKSVSHPALIKLLDHNIAEHWFVMEYFSGGTLSDHLDMYKGRVLEALRAFNPIVGAVAALHKAGIVHRDIKPTNIFLGINSLVLGDCGLAIRLPTQDRITETFENVGTRDYMPVWAYSMRLDDVKPTFDVYSLGKLLWAMVSGRPHFPLWRFDEDPHDLRTLFPGNAQMLLIHDILAKSVVSREEQCKFGDAGAMSKEVNQLIEVLDGRNAALDLEHTILVEILESNSIPDRPEITQKFARALWHRACRNKEFHPIYRQESESGESYINYREDEPSKSSGWHRTEPFQYEGACIFVAQGSKDYNAQEEARRKANSMSLGNTDRYFTTEIYILTNGNILECSVVRTDYAGPNDPSTQSFSTFQSITREGEEYSLEKFVQSLTQQQKKQLLFALVYNETNLQDSWRLS